jgi:putative NADH-flavin reductase
MKVLVVGASGATGLQVVKQLIEQHIEVIVIVRNPVKIDSLQNKENLIIITDSILNVDIDKLSEYLNGVDAIISCLGHNISIKGIYGKPHMLVTSALINLCEAIKRIKIKKKIKLILMNTTACLNPEIDENFTKTENIIMALFRFILPPQRDNEQAINYLRNTIGKNNDSIEWIAVRPDTLINEETVTKYMIYASTVRSPIFNAGKTSRINVANFMTSLLLKQDLWEKWKYRMPVVYNE